MQNGAGLVIGRMGQFYPSITYEPGWQLRSVSDAGKDCKDGGAELVACTIFIRHAFSRRQPALAMSQAQRGAPSPTLSLRLHSPPVCLWRRQGTRNPLLGLMHAAPCACRCRLNLLRATPRISGALPRPRLRQNLPNRAEGCRSTAGAETLNTARRSPPDHSGHRRPYWDHMHSRLAPCKRMTTV